MTDDSMTDAMVSSRRAYAPPVLVENGAITELTEAANNLGGPLDGAGFPNMYS